MCQPNRDSHPTFHGQGSGPRPHLAARPLRPKSWNKRLYNAFLDAKVGTRRSQRRLSWIARCRRLATSGEWRLGALTTETPLPAPQPGMAERAIDAATDVSRTVGEVAGGLRAAVDRLTAAIEEARRPGRPLSIVAAITREAPLASLFVAFLFGVAVARRR
jgi:hypothetical protein